VLCRPEDLAEAQWQRYALQRLPMIPYLDFPKLLAAADIIAIPQLDTEASRCQMPMKVYDCMAMAKPIVASAISDLPSTLDGCGIRVIRYKPRRRCLIEYELQSSDSPSKSIAVLGKVRAKALDRKTFRLQQTLWNGCFGPKGEERIHVPEPLGVLPPFQMWL